MKCQYCDATLKNPKARLCNSRKCQNRGKRDRLRLRRELNPGKYVSKPHQLIGDGGPPELQYLDDEPGITIDELLDVQRDPVIRRKARISRRTRQQKLLQRMSDAGLYDVTI